MRFAEEQWLWGVFLALVLAGIFVVQGLRVAASRARFGEEERVLALMTARPAVRRAISAVLICLAVAFAFVAAAQPQYGKGTRVLPATNLDLVLVLDFSKSMYARDVSPSRIARAKIEVSKMVRELGGARFGAVAFAGESISFPLTSDGAAIAQFFRGLEPNDMPVGGTAIARALESGRRLLDRDPLSKNHERVLVLITDGEDLEGDPVETARNALAGGVRVEVVQIGGQTPEPIPQVDDAGAVVGMRRDDSGKIMTTQLSAEGEAQLAGVASAGGGQLVRAAEGDVGVAEMKDRLRRLMTEELSERVETVYADVFHIPLAITVLLLVIEVWIGSARKRVLSPEPPPGQTRRRRLRRLQTTATLLALMSMGCQAADPLFERESPVVNQAIEALSAKDPEAASQLLIEYLETGPCEEGVIGVGDRARKHADASFDLALSFSAIARAGLSGAAPGAPAPAQAPGAVGQAPGTSGQAPGAPGQAPGAPGQGGEVSPELIHRIDCGIRLLAPIGQNPEQPAALRARSHYLVGNLELLRNEFAGAVAAYDEALLLTPGLPEGQGDALGAQAAFNRALALRLEKEKEEQEKQQEEQDQNSNQDEQDEQDQDKSEDEQESDEDDDSEDKKDEGEESNEDKSEDSSGDDEKPPSDPKEDEKSEPEEGDEQSEENDPQSPPSEQPNSPEQSASENSPSAARDERMLDLLEQAPTLQQHEAQKQKGYPVRGRATMEDK